MVKKEKNKVVKSVSFNLTNKKDLEYLERIEKINFSGYVKSLIEKDIRRRRIIPAENKTGAVVDGPIMTKGTSLVLLSE